MPSTHPRPDEAPDRRFQRFARSLGAPLLGERSIKLFPGGLSDNRYLLSLPGPALDADGWSSLASVPLQFGLPPEPLARFLAEARTADILHFGCDAEEGGTVLKLYAEHAARLRTDWGSARRSASRILVHRSVKWRATGEPEAAFSTYSVDPALSIPATAARISALLGEGIAAELVTSLLHRAAGRVAAEARMFLEVEEEGTHRRSFDLKLYDAGFTLGSLAASLSSLAASFSLGPEHQQRLAALPADAALGHISGGQGRDGTPFLTLYYGGGPL